MTVTTAPVLVACLCLLAPVATGQGWTPPPEWFQPPHQNPETVAAAFQAHRLLLEPFSPAPPPQVLGVLYNYKTRQGQQWEAVIAGYEFTPARTRKEPLVRWLAEPSDLYTLMMLDPDAPHPGPQPKFKNWLHWLVINIPGSNLQNGEVVAQYVGPTPPRPFPHRYVLLAYKQSGQIDKANLIRQMFPDLNGPFIEAANAGPRKKFSFEEFAVAAGKHLSSHHGRLHHSNANLELVAGNFFLARTK